MMKSILCLLLPFFFVACAHEKTAPVAPNAESAAMLYQWTQLVDGNKLSTKKIYSSTVVNPCGEGKLSKPKEGFPVNLCEYREKKSDKEIKKIVIFGDTGCRVMVNGTKAVIQNCNSSDEWPLEAVSKAAAKWKPDLVIHLGDYYYRESDCPAGDARCAGTFSGDNWKAWEQDFFAPAKELLAAAPWVFVRGNHEDCKRGGNGWFYFLDPRGDRTCTTTMAPLVYEYGGLNLGVIDAADAENVPRSLKTLGSLHLHHTWLLSHRPFLTSDQKDTLSSDPALPEYFSKPHRVSGLFAGHIHTLRVAKVARYNPLEFIIGIGGSSLDEKEQGPLKAGEKSLVDFTKFGFVTMEKRGVNRWDFAIHDVRGEAVKRCQFSEDYRPDFHCE